MFSKRPFSLFAVVCAALTFFSLTFEGAEVSAQTPAAPVAAPPAPAPVGKPRTWLVDNKGRLVTVKEKNGPPLFAQVITTNDLQIELKVIAATKKVTLTLKDAAGKRLYDMTFPHMEHGEFQFNADFTQNDTTQEKVGGTTFTFTPTEKDESDPQEKDTDGTFLFVLNSDDWPVHGDFVTGTSRTLIERVGTKLSFTSYENGKKTSERAMTVDVDKQKVIYSEDGKETSSVDFSKTGKTTGTEIRMNDNKGEVTSRSVKQDGKDYTEFVVGERRVLIEGANWKFKLKDGVLILTPGGDSAPAATNTANK